MADDGTVFVLRTESEKERRFRVGFRLFYREEKRLKWGREFQPLQTWDWNLHCFVPKVTSNEMRSVFRPLFLALSFFRKWKMIPKWEWRGETHICAGPDFWFCTEFHRKTFCCFSDGVKFDLVGMRGLISQFALIHRVFFCPIANHN